MRQAEEDDIKFTDCLHERTCDLSLCLTIVIST